MLRGDGKIARSESTSLGALESNGLLIRRGLGHVYLIIECLLQS